MAYIVYALDKPDSLELRLAHRPAHIEFLKAAGAKLLLAGPLKTESGDMMGSVLIVDYADEMAVHEWLQTDPYTKAGLFQSVSVSAFDPALVNFK